MFVNLIQRSVADEEILIKNKQHYSILFYYIWGYKITVPFMHFIEYSDRYNSKNMLSILCWLKTAWFDTVIVYISVKCPEN